MEERSEQLGPNTPDLHSAEADSNIRNQREYKDRGLGAQQRSETASERIFGGGQDDGDSDGLVQSGRSRGKSWYSDYTTVHVDHHC